MTITYGFFDSVDGDRKYSAEDIGRYLHGIVSSGVYADASDSLQILAHENMKCTLQPGRAMLDYHYMENDSPLYFGLANGDAQDRIDAIVLRLDKSGRLCQFAVKKGSPAAKPTAPTVTRTETVKEYMLATVYVRKLATAITQEDITDTRANNEVCGFVHGIIDQVDTSTLFAQYEAAYANKLAELDDYIAGKKAEIDDRLESIDTAINNAGTVGVPIPTAGNVGMVPAVNSDGTAYELTSINHPIKRVAIEFEDSQYPVKFNEYSDGLYLFVPNYTEATGVMVMAQTGTDADGTYVEVGSRTKPLLCYISKTPMRNMSYEIVKYVHTLHDFTTGRIISNEHNLSTGAWSYSTKNLFANA